MSDLKAGSGPNADNPKNNTSTENKIGKQTGTVGFLTNITMPKSGAAVEVSAPKKRQITELLA